MADHEPSDEQPHGRPDAPAPDAPAPDAPAPDAPAPDAATAAPPPGAVPTWREFARRRDGMLHAMDGGLWLHRHVWRGTPMAHLVSTDRAALLAWGRAAGIDARRLQFKPLKDPRTGERRNAWHWDLVGPRLPPRAAVG